MEFGPKDNERLRKVLVTAAVLGDAATAAQYTRILDTEGRARGYIYNLNKGVDWLFGIYRNEEMEVAQISGRLNEDFSLEIDTPRVSPEDVDTFKEVIEIASQSLKTS